MALYGGCLMPQTVWKLCTAWNQVAGSFPHELILMATGLSGSQEEGLLSPEPDCLKNPLLLAFQGTEARRLDWGTAACSPCNLEVTRNLVLLLGVSWGLSTANDLK